MKKNLEKTDINSQEFNPYKTDKFSKIPLWLRILFLKYWVAAAALFFFIIGNPLLNGTTFGVEVYYIVASLGIGLFQEYIIKPIVRLLRNSREDTYYYNVINLKGVLSLFANFLYAFIVMIPVTLTLAFLSSKGWILNLFNTSTNAGGIEPFTGGFVYLFFDFIVLTIKNSVIKLWKNHKYNLEEKKAQELKQQLVDKE